MTIDSLVEEWGKKCYNSEGFLYFPKQIKETLLKHFQKMGAKMNLNI